MLDAEQIDFDKPVAQVGGTGNMSTFTINRDSCDYIIDVHEELLNKPQKTLEQNYPSSKLTRAPLTAAQHKVGGGGGGGVAVVQGDTWGKTHGGGGLLLPPLRHMGGGEGGVPGKGRQDGMDNSDSSLTNNYSNKEAGVTGAEEMSGRGGVVSGEVLSTASIELSADSRWRNVRKTPVSPHTQATCLRQILLLQLDLIEQQQQQLQNKDKEIDELKADKDTLLARIERMERRLQLTRKDPRDKRLFQPLETWAPDKDDPWDLEDEDAPPPTPRTFGCSRGGKGGLKRKFCVLDSKVQKSGGRGKGPKFTPLKTECRGGQRELRSKETPEKMGFGPRFGLERDATLPPGCKEECELTAQMEDLPFMSTTEMYLCCWHQTPSSPLLCDHPSPKAEEALPNLAVPSWRDKSVEPLEEDACGDIPETLEQTLEDSVFLKRHAKLELDEKRRKRWDIQRVREQRMFQRLQQRMDKKKGIQEAEPEVTSFYPDTEDVESIIITPLLPVVAFGRPLPKLTQQSFQLPWMDDRGRSRGAEVPKKHTPHRTCRK